MHLRFVEYFVAVARERHFGRAAEACHVSQPTLSTGLAALEDSLGHRLVIRDRRFIDLTTQGHMILGFAQQLLADHVAMRSALNAEPGGLRGMARIGAIPAVMPAIGRFVAAVTAAHPRVKLGIASMTSREIERALVAHDIDAGLTYLDTEPLAQVRALALYAERFVAIAAHGSALARHDSVTLAALTAQRLCLLHQGMQNRRILDRQLAKRGLSVDPVVTADSYVALLTMVADGGLAAIITDSHAALVAAHPGLVTLTIRDAMPANTIGLVILDRTPASPLAEALFAIAATIDFPTSS